MTNPAIALVSSHWPHLWRLGWIRIVGRPATSYDIRQYDMEARMKDLARRTKAYAAKKKLK